jgi:glycosyltransferase involved in cell wall biosynthesis
MNPKVSVCITTYNHEKFIAQALDSVLMQKTDFEFEVLVGEDDSSDNTREIVKEYARKYPDKIRLFLNDRKNVIFINDAPTGRWNLVNNLKHSKGEFVALLDGDDYWVGENKLQKQIDFLNHNKDYSISFHNARVFNTVKVPEGVWSEYSDFEWNGIERSRSEYSQDDLLATPLCPTASIVFRRPSNFVFPEWFYQVMSGDMALESLVCKDRKIKYFDEFWSVYRKHASGITTSHFGDVIHSSRIFMYLRLMETLSLERNEVLDDVVKKHFKELGSLECFSSADLKVIFKRYPALSFTRFPKAYLKSFLT